MRYILFSVIADIYLLSCTNLSSLGMSSTYFREEMEKFLPRIKSASIGSGLGTDPKTQSAVMEIIKLFNEKHIPTVIDAVFYFFLS